MADSKVSALSSISTVGGTDLLYIVDDQGGGTLVSRKVTVDALTGGMTHNNLTGLTTGDPHTQYAYLNGRSGGQILHGGTNAGDILRLRSTTHATKGKVLLDTALIVQPTDGTTIGHRADMTNGGGDDESLLTSMNTDELLTFGSFICLERSNLAAPEEYSVGFRARGTGDTYISETLQIGIPFSTSDPNYISPAASHIEMGNSQPSAMSAGTDLVRIYCKDEAAGDARIYVQGEAGGVIKLGNGIVSATSFTATTASGVPVSVTSTALNPNLNADLLDGWDLADVVKGRIVGMFLSNAADADHDITVSPGWCWDNDATYGGMSLSAAITKRIDATWAEGNNQGGLVSGAVAPSTLYHVYAIGKATEVEGSRDVDVLFSTSTSFSFPSGGWHLKRRLGWVVTDGSANIKPFTHSDYLYLWNSPEYIIDTTTLGTTRTEFTWVDNPSSDSSSINLFRVYVEHATQDAMVLFTTDDEADTAPSATAGVGASVSTIAGHGMWSTIALRTDGDSIFARSSHTNTTLRVVRLGQLFNHRDRGVWTTV